MVEFLQQIFSGTATGCLYALVALGFVLIYKTTGIVSLANGALLMIGAYVTWALMSQADLPYLLALACAVLFVGGVGIAIDYFAIRPVHRMIHAVYLITLALAIAIRGAILMIPGWGTETLKVTTPISGATVRFGPFVQSAESIAVIVVTIILIGVMFAFFAYTRVGMAMQAMAQNRLAANYVGINTSRLETFVWGLSAGAAGLAGALLAPLVFVHSNMDAIGLKVLPAAVIGGLGSLPGAIVGGLIVGIAEALAGLYLPEGFKDVAAYILVLLVLAVHPSGLFGEHTIKKV